MIGTPVERSRQDVLDTIAYSIRLKPDFVMYNILTPFGGTTLYDEGLRDGVLDVEPWLEFMKNPDESFKAQVWDEHFSRDERQDLLLCLSSILLETFLCCSKPLSDSQRCRPTSVCWSAFAGILNWDMDYYREQVHNQR